MAIIVHGVRICCSVFLSVQCYAWTEYKFTSVCLSVCVSVTLSVNSPTGQTPQRIFTVDSLTDADLHKGVPFGSLDHIQGCKVPQNPHFGGLNRHFKPNMRKIQIEFFRSVYQIDMKFDRQLRTATETLWVVSYGGKTIPRWRTAAILKIVNRYIVISQRKIIRFLTT